MVKWLDKFGANVAAILLVVGIVVMLAAFAFVDVSFARVLAFALALSPIWLPLVLFLIFFEKWMEYVQKAFNIDQGRVTLEILLPEEIMKSPKAMELVIAQLAQKASPDNLVQTYWDGKNPPTFALELVSHGGSVHFYINTPRKKYKNIIEAQLYSQYPGIEIRELPIDYTAELDAELNHFDFFSIHFNKKKPGTMPIKTYVDYKLDMNPKEEEKIDPITQMLDVLGSIGPDERIWIQILIRAHREETFEVGSLTRKPDWTAELKKTINDLAMRDANRMGPVDLEGGMPRVTEGERFMIGKLEQRLSQYPFNTYIRAVYAARRGSGQFGERIGAIITGWNPFNGPNGIGVKWRTDFDYIWWQDPSGKKLDAHKRSELKDYRLRTFTEKDTGDKSSIFTEDELATIFHLPGRVATTPTIGRIPSARSEAPPNLPVGTP